MLQNKKTILSIFGEKNGFKSPLLLTSAVPLQQLDDAEILRKHSAPPKLKLLEV
jgi:hypothetical protein